MELGLATGCLSHALDPSAVMLGLVDSKRSMICNGRSNAQMAVHLCVSEFRTTANPHADQAAYEPSSLAQSLITMVAKGDR